MRVAAGKVVGLEAGVVAMGAVATAAEETVAARAAVQSAAEVWEAMVAERTLVVVVARAKVAVAVLHEEEEAQVAVKPMRTMR